MSKIIRKAVGDLGAAAYAKMNGFKCAGRKSRNFYFDLQDEELPKFEEILLEYINSPFHVFDSELMALKKTNEYLPD